MSEGKRPGGLTALAVLNFCGAGLGVLAVLGLGWWIAVINVPELRESLPKDEDFDVALRAMQDLGTTGLVGLIAAEGVVTFLLLASGIGYLHQKRFLGRTLGNVYAVLSIAATVTKTALVESKEAGGEFQLITIAMLLYPVLTLILLNTTFKEDFVR